MMYGTSFTTLVLLHDVSHVSQYNQQEPQVVKSLLCVTMQVL